MYNRAILIGRLTADPELKTTGSGTHVIGFSIAVDRRYVSGGERKADFINITAWRQTAEFVSKYFHKGDAIGVEGSIQTRSYEDKTGAKRTATEVVADNVFFVGGKSSNSGANTTVAQPMAGNTAYSNGAPQDFIETEIDGDLPF